MDVAGFVGNRGHFGDVSLDGLCFVLAGVSPRPMGEGNWKVGLIVDERADAAQEQAISSLARGRAGGPLAAFAPFITSFLGVERKSIRFEKDALRRSVSIPGVLDQALEGVPSPTVPGEPLVLDNCIRDQHSLPIGRAVCGRAASGRLRQPMHMRTSVPCLTGHD